VPKVRNFDAICFLEFIENFWKCGWISSISYSFCDKVNKWHNINFYIFYPILMQFIGKMIIFLGIVGPENNLSYISYGFQDKLDRTIRFD